jgi:DNA/RNA endonuclease YhcR with UshA esterase domain
MKKLCLLLFASVLMAEEPIAVTDQEALKSKENQEVTVTGVTNASSTISKDGHFFYNFEGTNFSLFCFKASAEQFPEEKRPTALIGKTIKVTGKITTHKEKLQIAIRKAEQIEVVNVEPAEKTTTPAEADQKKK